MIALISTSLNPESKSRILLNTLAASLDAAGIAHQVIDLRDYDLPLCDGAACYGSSEVEALTKRLNGCTGFVLGLPIYNYTVGAAVKNLIELVGSAFSEKPVGIVAAAGGARAYMAPLGLMNSLMLDFRLVPIPKYVYATPADFDSEGKPMEEVSARLAELGGAVARVANALSGVNERRAA